MAEFKPIGGTEFITSPPPGGMGMKFYANGAGNVRGVIAIDRSKQGPPGHAHGGSLIALLDEAMGAAAWNAGHQAVAANLQFNLRASVPLETDVSVYGEVVRVEGRKVFCTASVILPDGSVAVEAEGIFVNTPEKFTDSEVNYNPFDSHHSR